LKVKRAIIIVMDSAGIGEMPDSCAFGDQGSNTLGNILKEVGVLKLTNLQSMGLGNISQFSNLSEVNDPQACYGKMAEMSVGKDTTTGHWEIAGIVLNRPFPFFPNGFPPEFIFNFQKRIGREVLGNEAASGTEIIERLGPEHVRTGKPIIYTSADSVLQIAVHEEVIPLEELMNICRTAREILTGDLEVARVIARPFTGQVGSFQRTSNRHDFSIPPPGRTLLDIIAGSGQTVLAVGKINDIFTGSGVSEYVPSKNNMDGINKTVEYLKRSEPGLIFTNLVDFDMLFGHRNNVCGYAGALEEFDSRLPEILDTLKDEDILFITADHGCDPTTPGTDHTREYVPLLVYGKKIKKGIDLGIRNTFADLGATVAEYLGVERLPVGQSFYQNIKEENP